MNLCDAPPSLHCFEDGASSEHPSTSPGQQAADQCMATTGSSGLPTAHPSSALQPVRLPDQILRQADAPANKENKPVVSESDKPAHFQMLDFWPDGTMINVKVTFGDLAGQTIYAVVRDQQGTGVIEYDGKLMKPSAFDELFTRNRNWRRALRDSANRTFADLEKRAGEPKHAVLKKDNRKRPWSAIADGDPGPSSSASAQSQPPPQPQPKPQASMSLRTRPEGPVQHRYAGDIKEPPRAPGTAPAMHREKPGPSSLAALTSADGMKRSSSHTLDALGLLWKELRAAEARKERRPDLKALNTVLKKTIIPKAFGALPEVPVGQCFSLRVELAVAGVHRHFLSSICATPTGVESLLLAEGTNLVRDRGDTFEWMCAAPTPSTSSHSLRDSRSTAFMYSHQRQLPIRVTRGTGTGRSTVAPASGFRYDGLYSVEKFTDQGSDLGVAEVVFTLKRCAGQLALGQAPLEKLELRMETVFKPKKAGGAGGGGRGPGRPTGSSKVSGSKAPTNKAVPLPRLQAESIEDEMQHRRALFGNMEECPLPISLDGNSCLKPLAHLSVEAALRKLQAKRRSLLQQLDTTDLISMCKRSLLNQGRIRNAIELYHAADSTSTGSKSNCIFTWPSREQMESTET